MGNIVLLVRNAAKSDFGGAETYQVSIAKVLQENEWSPIVVSRSDRLLSYAREHDVKTIRGWWWSRQDWSGKRILLSPIYIAWQLLLTLWYLQLIIRTNASVLHIQSKDDFIAGTIAGYLLRKKIIWTDHMDLRYVFQNLTTHFKNPIGKLVALSAHLASHIILISNNEHSLVTAHFRDKDYLKSKITIIKNGVIDQKSQYVKQTHAEFIFCLASRLVDNKGLVEAIEAFKQVEGKLNRNDLRLHIYGDGLEESVKRYKGIAKDNEHILFFGHQTNAIEKISKSDVFMLPSYQEGFSIALLEATMLGKAIIASDVDSNPELINNGVDGLLISPRDPSSLAEAMQKLVEDPTLLSSLEVNARKNYESYYDLKMIVTTKIIPLYS